MSSEKVEDLVKDALKKALDKRKTFAPTVEETYIVGEETEDTTTTGVTSSTTFLKYSDHTASSVLEKAVAKDFEVTVFKDYPWDESIASFVPDASLVEALEKTLLIEADSISEPSEGA